MGMSVYMFESLEKFPDFSQVFCNQNQLSMIIMQNEWNQKKPDFNCRLRTCLEIFNLTGVAFVSSTEGEDCNHKSQKLQFPNNYESYFKCELGVTVKEEKQISAPRTIESFLSAKAPFINT